MLDVTEFLAIIKEKLILFQCYEFDYSMKFLKKLIAWKPPFLKAGYKCFYAYYKFTQAYNLYMLLTSTLFSLATDYTATSYIYQSLGDVEWYIEMKLSSWQQ